MTIKIKVFIMKSWNYFLYYFYRMAEDNPVVNEAQLEDEMMQDNG